ncbi:MAG: hypothetical protein LBG48_00555 [Rickettsiales bacterium]|nr:hypothetical protein [Rickettsiales bacterium]
MPANCCFLCSIIVKYESAFSRFVIAVLVLLGETNEMQSNLRERSTAIQDNN